MGLHDVKKADAEELREFMKLLLRDVRALERMLEEGRIESGVRRIGAEQELFLVDEAYKPARTSPQILEELDDPHFTTELGIFNIEYNLDPLMFGGKCLSEMEVQLVDLLRRAHEVASRHDTAVVMTGILPTLRLSELSLDWMTPNPRYFALNDALCKLRGGKYAFQIKGTDEFRVQHDNVMLESCNTSFQVHFQAGPAEFARLYNIAQACAAPTLAVATNSPMLFGKRLWAETRIALFQQSIDTRGQNLRERMPRVSFGSRWLDDSVLEIFREDVSRFRLLIHTEVDDDPLALLDQGVAPSLKALRLHNGTVYRWNRACYGVGPEGVAHLRIENRVLPSGPTTLDEMANAAFWFGLMVGVDENWPDVRDHIEFDEAKTNFLGAARYGLNTSFKWLDGQNYPAADLIQHQLVPLARESLKNRGLDADDVDRYLDVVEDRVRSGQTGGAWILRSFQQMKERRALSERLSAITAATIRRQQEGRPVHEWPLAEVKEGARWKDDFRTVGQFMSTDLYTVNADELVDLVASVMDWQQVRHIPVEDDDEHLVGLVTYRSILRHLTNDRDNTSPVPVSTIMQGDVVTVTADTPTLDAIRMMREQHLSCLPVIDDDGKLIGMVTEEDFLDIARELLEEGLRS